jgi:ribosomal-protein-alanine N-acetyltransferase
MEEKMKQWIPNESYADIAETEGAINFYMECVNKRELPYVLAIDSQESGELIGDTGVNVVEGSDCEVSRSFCCRR